MTEKFNPVLAARAKKWQEETLAELAPEPAVKKQDNPLQPSHEVVPPPPPQQYFDTTTPAGDRLVPRRFTLGDLPRYADKMYPILKKLFPHINDRMYGGWLRGCIDNNSCLFLCVDGAVAMAHVMHWPMNPQPFILISFVIGSEEGQVPLYEHILQWAKNTGADDVISFDPAIRNFDNIKGQRGLPTKLNFTLMQPA